VASRDSATAGGDQSPWLCTVHAVNPAKIGLFPRWCGVGMHDCRRRQHPGFGCPSAVAFTGR
jgi:hypothetical protein